MNHMEKLSTIALAGVLGCGLVACGDGTTDGAEGAEQVTAASSENLNCSSSAYIAFDSANHANQDIRLATYADMNDLMKAGEFTAARELYQDADASAKLQEKVQGRKDEHIADAPVQGERMDATILAWLDAGAATDDELVLGVAKQWVDKTLGEFFFLSVHHEILAGARKNWDEALGYFGSSTDNDEGDLIGLASTAAKRDGNNGTTLETDIYNNLILGACELDRALGADGESVGELSDAPDLQAVIDNIDVAMIEVLAYSVGHEAFEMEELAQATEVDAAKLTIKAAELGAFFIPVERIMVERGGESATRAQTIRTLIDAMADFDPEAPDFSDDSWMQDMGDAPATIIETLETEFEIDIKA